MSVLSGLSPTQLEMARSFGDGIAHGTSTGAAGLLHLKVTSPLEGEAEAHRLAWLAGRAGAPKLVGFEALGDRCVLGSEELLATPVDSLENILAGEISLVRCGVLLARLHALDPAGCPFVADRSAAFQWAERRIRCGAVDPNEFPPALAGYRPERVLELAAVSIPTEVAEAPVLCHGRPQLSHLLVGEGGGGPVGLGQLGLGDRYLDLAQLLAAVATRFGHEAMVPVLEGYGLDKLDRPRLDGYGLLALLL